MKLQVVQLIASLFVSSNSPAVQAFYIGKDEHPQSQYSTDAANAALKYKQAIPSRVSPSTTSASDEKKPGTIWFQSPWDNHEGRERRLNDEGNLEFEIDASGVQYECICVPTSYSFSYSFSMSSSMSMSASMSMTDTFSVSESPVFSESLSFSLSDTFSLSEVFSDKPTNSPVEQFSESLSMSMSDTFSISETIEFSESLSFSLSDTFSFSEVFSDTDTPTTEPVPTSSPTSGPTTEVPTGLPTPGPTPVTEEPTDMPSVSLAPTEETVCIDDSTFSYDGNAKQDCEWIGKNESRRLEKCGEAEVLDACVFTCGACCYNSKHFIFIPSFSAKKKRDCEWIEKDGFLVDIDVCSEVYEGTLVSSMCPKACGTCKSPAFPTEPPTLSPTETLPPSNLPSVSPSTSLSPSVAPSSTPTGKASAAPSGACVDDPDYLFQNREGKDCAFVRSTEQIRFRKCKITAIRESCPVSCGTCCADNADFEFVPVGSDKTRDCAWIVEKNREDTCTETYEGVLVSDMCIAACDTCFTPAIPTDMPTNAPTVSDPPSTSPTVTASAIPSTVPSSLPTLSSVPTAMPTDGPTKSPTATPTEVPSIAPTYICEDTTAKFGSSNKLTCDELATYDDARRINKCKNTNFQEFCPVACGICCEDSRVFEFNYKGKARTCEWLRTEKSPSKIVDICEEQGDSLQGGCAETCQSCFNNTSLLL